MTGVSQEIERFRKRVFEAAEAIADVGAEAIRSNRAPEQEDSAFLQVQEELEEAVAQLEATAEADVLKSYDVEAPYVRHEGRLYRKVAEPSSDAYAMMRGKRSVERHLYREVGVHNGPTICPLELRAGIVEGTWSPKAAKVMAEYGQELPSRAASRLSSAAGVVPYSHASFTRVPKNMGEQWEANRQSFEDATVCRSIPEDTASVSVAVDRVSLPMKAEDGVNYKMAWCGTVTLHDEEGEPLETRRVGMCDDREEAFRRRLKSEVEAVFEHCGEDVPLVALSDGENYLCEMLDDDYEVEARRIDFWHVVEKLGAALRAFCASRSTTRGPEETLKRWKFKLLNDDDAIEAIERAIRRWGAEDLQMGQNRPVHAALTYIENHREQMKYASLRDQGLPIGSGQVEATCKQLVQMRMKRNGQRWRYPGAQAILDLRSLALSDHWERGIGLILDEYRGSVTPTYAVS